MQVERKWHILSTIFFFLLITSGQCMDSKEVKPKERRTLLDLILQVIRDSQQRETPASKRCISGLLTSAQDMKFSSREKPLYVPRLDNSRLIEMAPRDVNMKGKIIQHFTGPVKFSSECRTHFHRVYHNTRDCSRPACSSRWLSSGETDDDEMRFFRPYRPAGLGLQKMCQIANTISNESTLHAIVDIACSKTMDEGPTRC